MFLLMLSCGFDADVVRRMHRSRRSHISRWSYAGPILSSLGNYTFPEFEIEYRRRDSQEQGQLGSIQVEGDRWTTIRCHWAFVFNAPVYAAGLRVVDSADPADGLLDVATFEGGSIWHGLRQFWSVWRGDAHRFPGFRHVRADHVKIRIRAGQALCGNCEPPCYQIDGDPGGELPVEIDIVPRRLQLVAAPESPSTVRLTQTL